VFYLTAMVFIINNEFFIGTQLFQLQAIED
jgi:hypothetical protein